MPHRISIHLNKAGVSLRLFVTYSIILEMRKIVRYRKGDQINYLIAQSGKLAGIVITVTHSGLILKLDKLNYPITLDNTQVYGLIEKRKG